MPKTSLKKKCCNSNKKHDYKFALVEIKGKKHLKHKISEILRELLANRRNRYCTECTLNSISYCKQLKSAKFNNNKQVYCQDNC